MTAAVAVMATTPTTSNPAAPKRHGFSIESLIGRPDSPPRRPSPGHHPLAALSRPLPVRPAHLGFTRELIREERLYDRSRGERAGDKGKDRRELSEGEQCVREVQMALRGSDLILDLQREKNFKGFRERDMFRDRDTRDDMDGRDGKSSHPLSQRRSPHSNTSGSPQTEKCQTPETTENRLGMWPGEELKHLMENFPGAPMDHSGIYPPPLRICNRSLATLGGLSAHGGPPGGPLGVGMHHHFAHLPMNPLLYNLPRDLTQPPHPLLASRYPGFMHPRYPLGPPGGLLFHPYRKPKRNRTAFSPSQLLQLEQAFEKNHYVVGQERKTLASKLQLTETQVKVWFQNRRTKHKRMKAEEDGGSSGSHAQDGDEGKGAEGSDFSGYMDEEDPCSEEDEDEELSVTEEC